jgi:large conductance mechanosensitive channel
MTEEKLKKKQAKKQAKKEKKQKFWADFKKFITRGNVVDMAVGVAVASAFTAIVTAFTKGFVTPLLSMLTSKTNLSEMKTILRAEKIDPVTEEILVPEVALLWGDFLHAIVNFLIIALSMFMIMRIAASIKAHYEKIAKKVKEFAKEEEIAAAKAKEAEEKAKAEAEAKAKAEAEAAAAAKLEAEKAEDKARLVREEELLREIRDLLKAKG